MKALYDSIINMILVKIYFGYLFQMKEYLCTPNVMVCKPILKFGVLHQSEFEEILF